MNEPLLPVSVTLAACLLTAALVYLLARRGTVPACMLVEARQRLAAADTALEAARIAKSESDLVAEQAAAEMRKLLDETRCEKARQGEQLAAVRATLAQERQAAAEKLELLQGARDALALQFKSLAEDLMLRHGETFKAQNLAQVEQLLGPMRDRLADFRAGLETAQTETVKERAALGEHIRSLTENSGRIASETTALTRALKGDVRLQGAWGEMVLETILERSGLVEDEHYFVQDGVTGEGGRQFRPDVVVRLPGDQNLVVDSKVSLLAFEEYVNADDEAVRAAALARHRASVRAHIAGLGKKDYAEVASSRLGYVIMFVPIEGALSAALTADPNLTAFALEHHVCIATPITLMAMLRTVSVVWRTEQRNRNAEAIAARAGALYDKLTGFVVDLQKVGTCLGAAKTSYDLAVAKLSTGRGNALGQVELLKRMGAKARKALPEALLASAGLDEADEMQTLDEPAA